MISSWRLSLNVSDKLYRHSDRYELKRRSLLGDVVDHIDGKGLRKGFRRDFDRLLEELSFGMIRDGDDFYALFTRDMARTVDFSLHWPMATIVRGSDIVLAVNPISFLFMSEKEARALIRHEVLHLILDHHTRERALKNRFSTLAINLAMDVAVNQYIRYLPGYCERLASVNARLSLDLRMNETLEHYAEEIHRALERAPEKVKQYRKDQKIDFSHVHDAWNLGNDLRKETSREKLDAMLQGARKAPLPEELKSLLKIEDRSLIDWKSTLRRALITMPAGKRRTVTRRNRRQPDRLDLKGELRNFVPEVVVAIDISASIDDGEIRRYLTEIFAITRNYSKQIRILECDNEVRADYEAASIEDVRPCHGRTGGTAFSPVFQLLKEERQHHVLLVYFTDGEGEKKLTVRPRHRTLYVVTGRGLSLEEPYGEVISIRGAEKPVEMRNGLDAMREMLQEWAK